MSSAPSDPPQRVRKRKSGWETENETPAQAGAAAVAALNAAASASSAAAPTPQAVPINPLIALQMQQQQMLLLRQTMLQQQQMALLASKGPVGNNSACRIYVGSLTYDLTEEIIKVPFSVFGPIAKIEMPKENGHSKGYCFIDYTSPDHASNALTSMNGFIINGRPIKVNRSSQGTGAQGITTTIESAQQARAEAAAKLAAIGIDSDVGVVSSVAPSTAIGPGKVEHRIYVGSVMFDLTADQLKEVFEPFGAVISCQLIPNPETGKHKGYGFIEFDNEKSAADAMQNMDGFDLCGRKLKVGRVSMANAPNGAAAGGMSADALVALATMSSTSGLSTGFSVAALTAQARAMVSQKEESASSLTLICLRNMIAAADVDSDFEGEVREECEQFGAVVSVKVYVDPLPPNEDEAVRVFVKFAEAEAANKAKKSLDQRWFGGRVVRCDFYDEFKFARGEY